MAAVPSIGRASFVEAPRVAPEAVATQGLYERHAAKIQSYCMHQLGSREEAEDAVQTTFMNAFRALGRGVVPEAESAWLFKIAENVCLSRRRSSWRRGRIESPSDFGVIEEIVPGPSGRRDELIGIEDALASMPEQQRRAILLREWQGLSYREVAAELEVSQSAVETLIFRARRSLAQGLEQPDSIKPAKRKSFRRALHALDLGTVLAAAKTLLAGSAAVKATAAAAVAVTAVAGTAATVAPKLERKAPAKAPATVLVASAPAQSSTSSLSSRSFAPSAAGTAAAASKPLAIAALRPGTQMPARAVVSRSAPPRGVPAAPAPVPAVSAAPTAETPVAQPIEPVQAEQPTVEPTPAPAPAAEQPQHEERKHETPPPPAEPAKRTDEGRQGTENRKGNSTEPVAPTQQPVAAVLEELKRRIGKGRHDERHDPPVVEVPAPSSITAAVPGQTEPEEQKGEGKKERWKGNGRRDNDRRDLAVPPVISDPVPTPAVDAPAPTPAEQPAAAAAPASVPEQRLGEGDKGNRSGRRKGK